jgi:hypothetical protein
MLLPDIFCGAKVSSDATTNAQLTGCMPKEECRFDCWSAVERPCRCHKAHLKPRCDDCVGTLTALCERHFA